MIAGWTDSRVSVSDGRMSEATAVSAGAVTRAGLALRSRDRQLRIRDLERLDARLTCEQGRGPGKKHPRPPSADVGLAFGVGIEGVEDSECRGPEPHGKERRGPGLLPDDRHQLPDQPLDGFLLSGLRLEPNEQADHGTLHPPPRPGFSGHSDDTRGKRSRYGASPSATVSASQRLHARRAALQDRPSQIAADESGSEPSSNDRRSLARSDDDEADRVDDADRRRRVPGPRGPR